MNDQERQILVEYLAENFEQFEAFVVEMGFEKKKAEQIVDNFTFG